MTTFFKPNEFLWRAHQAVEPLSDVRFAQAVHYRHDHAHWSPVNFSIVDNRRDVVPLGVLFDWLEFLQPLLDVLLEEVEHRCDGQARLVLAVGVLAPITVNQGHARAIKALKHELAVGVKLRERRYELLS